mmetsp:Transcript_50681/g.61115  ORF Transcript_50681/g.61115 Transcript_50681/m.61115 type:complete len:118 (+) Transcript_50681:3-356(+)
MYNTMVKVDTALMSLSPEPPDHVIDYYLHMPMEAIYKDFAGDTARDDAANMAATNNINIDETLLDDNANAPIISEDTDDSSATVADNDVMMNAAPITMTKVLLMMFATRLLPPGTTT